MAERPVHSIRVAGSGVEAAVWKNQRKDGSGVFFKATFSLNYLEGEEWKKSDSFGERESVALANAALQAAHFIGQEMRKIAKEAEPEKDNEKEKGKGRSRSAA